MNYGMEVVRRCTINGVTRWAHVAAQLGLSVETAKALHGPVKPADEDAEPERPPVKRR